LTNLNMGSQAITVDKKYNRFSRPLFSEAVGNDITGYWTGCWKFWHIVKDKPIDQLTMSQINWLGKIEHELLSLAKNYTDMEN